MTEECDCIIGYIVIRPELVRIYKSDDNEVKSIIEIYTKVCTKCGRKIEDED